MGKEYSSWLTKILYLSKESLSSQDEENRIYIEKNLKGAKPNIQKSMMTEIL